MPITMRATFANIADTDTNSVLVILADIMPIPIHMNLKVNLFTVAFPTSYILHAA